MSRVLPTLAAAALAVTALATTASIAGAQAAAAKHPAVCGEAVRVYHEKSEIPVPHDTVSLPPGPPVRVTSPEEAEAAERDLRARAGSAGANGVLVVMEEMPSGDGEVRMRRNVTAIFVPADSARSIAACRKP